MTSLHKLIALIFLWASIGFMGATFYANTFLTHTPALMVALITLVFFLGGVGATWLITRPQGRTHEEMKEEV